MTPVKSVTNLGIGFAEIFNQPIRQFGRKDGKITRGIVRGITTFIRTLTIESLNLADVLVGSTQSALEVVREATTSSTGVTRAPSEMGDEEDEVMEWTAVEKGAKEREFDPSSAIEGIKSGSDVLIRGIRMTRDGYILQPVIGATQAVSVVLRGARSTLDSGRHRAETERKYKAPYVQEEMIG
jgi:hypothetical protein